MQIKQKLESKNHEALRIYVRKQPGTEQVKDYDKLKPHFSFFSAKEKKESNRAVLLQNHFMRSQRPFRAEAVALPSGFVFQTYICCTERLIILRDNYCQVPKCAQ